MTSFHIMTGHEPDADWQLMAQFYQNFANSEGSRAQVTPIALQHAALHQNPGYRLAMIATHGFIAWTQHPDHPVEILDLFIEPNARRQGLAQHAVNHLAHFEVPGRRLRLAMAKQNKTAQAFYTKVGFEELDVQLLFPRPNPGKVTPCYYDVEGDEWLPATWPTMPNTPAELNHVVAQGATRLWLDRSIPTPSNWPKHPFARCYQLDT